MNISLIISALATLLASCAAQGFLGGIAQVATNLLEPIININNGQDGYRFRYATDDQVREEMGGFENGVWTVRGVVEWLSPDRKTKHKEMYVADDKGYKADVEDEAFGRAGLSPGALSALSG